ncbi:MAG: hypothetical protein ACK466_00065, partial [Pseudanabaena sp.]
KKTKLKKKKKNKTPTKPTTKQKKHTTVTPPSPLNPSPTKQSKASPEEFIKEYYSLINTQQLTAAWQNLTPKFQRDGANGINSFTNWWQSVDQVTVDSMNIIELKDNSAVINISLTYKQGKKISSEILRISLLWNETSKQWQINETKRQ